MSESVRLRRGAGRPGRPGPGPGLRLSRLLVSEEQPLDDPARMRDDHRVTGDRGEELSAAEGRGAASVTAVTVAVLGMSRSRAISPKPSPGASRVRIGWPPRVTATAPDSPI